jgi:hypothetical protein
VKVMARQNIVAAALTQLAEPRAEGVDGLVSAATRGRTRLLPVMLSLDHRVTQVGACFGA